MKSVQVWLWALLVVQLCCAAFFVFDAVADWQGREDAANFRHYHSFELLVALCAGLLATAVQNHTLARRQLAAASSAFALLAIKGLALAEITSLRQTKEATVMAQCAAIYRKAGVSGRLQLLSFFIEELPAEPLLPATALPARMDLG